LSRYITGGKGKPTANDQLFSQSESENFLVMPWLKSIARGYLLLDSASKIRNAPRLTYSQLDNDAQIFELTK
jgi:hypothetical protein